MKKKVFNYTLYILIKVVNRGNCSNLRFVLFINNRLVSLLHVIMNLPHLSVTVKLHKKHNKEQWNVKSTQTCLLKLTRQRLLPEDVVCHIESSLLSLIKNNQ